MVPVADATLTEGCEAGETDRGKGNMCRSIEAEDVRDPQRVVGPSLAVALVPLAVEGAVTMPRAGEVTVGVAVSVAVGVVRADLTVAAWTVEAVPARDAGVVAVSALAATALWEHAIASEPDPSLALRAATRAAVARAEVAA